jgi:membrane-associated phospholipid phosphatase
MRVTGCLRFASASASMAATVVFLIVATTLSTPQTFAQEPDNIDVRLFRLINGQQDTTRTGFFEILDDIALPSYVAVPAGFVAIGGIGAEPRELQTGMMLLTSEGLTVGVTALLKALTGRPRPFQALPDVRLKHEWSAGGWSFPSGHSSLAFSVATLVSLQYKNVFVTVPLFVWASLTAYGRVYLGVHYPSDVLGGAVLGAGMSILIWQFKEVFREASTRILGVPDPIVSARAGGKAGISLICIEIPLH